MKQNQLKELAVILLTYCFITVFPFHSASQSCVPTGFNGRVYDYVCPQTCSTLVAQIPHIKGTETYTVSVIPHTPYPWNSGIGTEIAELYADDTYSSVISLPFPFCFYGSVYNSCVVGSNGLISFDISNAGLANSWSLTTVPHGNIPQPAPYAGGVQNDVTSTYYPKAAIMGAYHDIYPLLNPSGQRRIEYATLGTAPCRKFVVSYYLVPLYGSTICNGRFCTQQIVLHENTGVIDVHLGDKPVCNAWNMGLAILGVQNWNRDAAITAPGKNCTVWNETGTSYRFTPSGNGSRFVKSEMFTLGGVLVTVADTLTTTAGLLDIRFQNICPPPDTTRFEIRTTYSSCNNPSQQLINYDTITTIRDNNLGASATSTNNACGPPSGTITAVVPTGAGTAPYTYVLDGGAPVTTGNSYTFTGVLHGPHTVIVTDANGAAGCISTIPVTVGRDNGILANSNTTPTFCSGSSSGSATISVSNGTGPYQFNLNNGVMIFNGPSPHTFNGLSAGSYNVIITDATGCLSNPILFDVLDGPGVSGSVSTTATSCPTAANGSITVLATAGVAPFRFVLDGGPPQSGPNPYTFINLPAGPHSVTILDNVGCSLPINLTVPPGPVLSSNNEPFATTCNGAMDGIIRVTPLSGLAPFTCSLDGLPAVPGPVPFIFTGQNSGIHNIQVFDAAGCASQIYAVTIPDGPALQTTISKTDVLCHGGTTGTITVNQPATGQSPFQYSLDGINWQTGNVFTGLPANTYTVRFRSANGCTGNTDITISEPATLIAALVMTPVICAGESNGLIAINSSGGVAPYQYSIDGGVTWQNGNQFQVPAGNFNVLVKDRNNCTEPGNILVTEPPPLLASATITNASCDGGNDGKIVISSSGGNGGYQYSLDGLRFQSSNIFNTGPGNFTIYVRDNKGCNTSFSSTVGLNFNLFLNPMPDPSICEGSSIQLKPVSNATRYTWTPPTGLDFPFVADPVASPRDSTWYYLKAELGGCVLYDTIRLNVHKAPVPDAGPGAEICYGQSYTLQGNGGVNYNWTPALYLSSTTGPNPVSTPTRSTLYTLQVRDGFGCESLVADTVLVAVRPALQVHTYPYDTILAPGVSIPLLAVSPGVRYQWTPSFGLSDPDIPDPVFSAANSIGDQWQYQVHVTDSSGCSGEGYVKIRIFKGPAIYVPTAFTPNGDGRNERFTPHPVGIREYHYFRIFNRWGQLVFSTKALNSGWDGTINGLPQPPGIYIWMIEGVTLDNKRLALKGSLTLIR